MRGPYPVGVQTLQVIHPDQLDILNFSEGNPDPRYDRPLTLEVWYPALLQDGQQEITFYSDVLGSGPNDPQRPNLPFDFPGRAQRKAQPCSKDGPYPLVILSHGYPGSRVLLTYLTENLASKGYIVVAIDHTESKHGDKAALASSLLNRPLDILFVLQKLAELGRPEAEGFLAGLVDANRTALIGYSLGGYGVLNTVGAGISEAGVNLEWGVPGKKLSVRQMGRHEYEETQDPRVKAVVALAPWGYPHFFDEEGLRGLKVPSLFIVGSMDTTSGYENVKSLFVNAVHSDRYLLVYQNGDHEIAVNPAPAISASNMQDYLHYQEPAWDNTRCNNINQHFISAFIGIHLKGERYLEYLDVPVPIANQASWSVTAEGSPIGGHTYWKGFKKETLIGLELHHLAPIPDPD